MSSVCLYLFSQRVIRSIQRLPQSFPSRVATAGSFTRLQVGAQFLQVQTQLTQVLFRKSQNFSLVEVWDSHGEKKIKQFVTVTDPLTFLKFAVGCGGDGARWAWYFQLRPELRQLCAGDRTRQSDTSTNMLSWTRHQSRSSVLTHLVFWWGALPGNVQAQHVV